LTDPVVARKELAAEEEAAGRPSLLSSSILTYGTLVLAAGLSLVNVFVVARSLGPTGRGDVAFLTTIGFLVTQAGSIGIDQANVNFASKDPRRIPALGTNSFLLAFILGTASSLIVLALTAVFPVVGGDVSSGLRLLILATIPFLMVSFFLTHLIESAYGFVTLNLAYLLPPVMNVLGNGILALFGVLSVGLALGTWIFGQFLALIVIVAYVQLKLGGFGRPDPGLAKRQVRFGIKAQGGRLMLLGNYRLDQWILGAISGTRELGLYSVAVSWAEATFFVPAALTTAQRPDLARAEKGDAARDAAAAFRIALLLSLVCVIGLIVLAPFLCETLFGPEFAASTSYLRILALGAFGIAALKMLGSALTAQRRPLLETGAISIAFVIIVVLDFVLIPAYGGTGASIASTISYSIGGVAISIVFARALGARMVDLVPRPSDAKWFLVRMRAGVAELRSGR
jgi:O-antigen/teichoic acid export membrane protein